jgi:hypothetical protein
MSIQNEDTLTKFEDFDYLPVYYYKGKKNSWYTKLYSTFITIKRNAFGEKVVFSFGLNSYNHEHMNRGDVHHRVGGIITEKEHDELIEMGDFNRANFMERMNNKNGQRNRRN